jgi:molybdopterin synthase sulfur carrier subunit
MPVAAMTEISVRVLLFASYAESIGREAVELALPGPATVADVVSRIRRLPGGQSLPPKPLCARNLAHAGQDDRVEAGDEIAILPPLAGG